MLESLLEKKSIDQHKPAWKPGFSSLTHWPWDTRISTSSHAHTPHCVFLTLKRQCQPSCPGWKLS